MAAARLGFFLSFSFPNTWSIRLESSAFQLQTAAEDLVDKARLLLQDVNHVTLFLMGKNVFRGH